MLSKMAAENYDARKFKVCGPWNNQRGGSWSEGFKPRFEDGLRTHTDNYSTLYETLSHVPTCGVIGGFVQAR